MCSTMKSTIMPKDIAARLRKDMPFAFLSVSTKLTLPQKLDNICFITANVLRVPFEQTNSQHIQISSNVLILRKSFHENEFVFIFITDINFFSED